MEPEKGRSAGRPILQLALVLIQFLAAIALLAFQRFGSTDQVLSLVGSQCPSISETADKLYIKDSWIGPNDPGFGWIATVAMSKLPAEFHQPERSITKIERDIGGSVALAGNEPLRGGRLTLHLSRGKVQEISTGDLGLEASQQCLEQMLLVGGLVILLLGAVVQGSLVWRIWPTKERAHEEITGI